MGEIGLSYRYDRHILMGRLPTGNRKYQISHIWDIHREVMRRLVLGQKPIEIARALGISPAMVSYTQNSSIVISEMNKLRKDRDTDTVSVAKRIAEMSPKAIETLEDIMGDVEESPRALRAKVAMDVLDRAGHGAPKKVVGAVLHGHLTSNEVEKIKQIAKENARGNGLLSSGNGEDVAEEVESEVLDI